MKKYAILLWLGLLAAPAFSQTNEGARLGTRQGGTGTAIVQQPKGQPVGGMLSTDSTFHILRVNSSNNLLTQEAAPIQDQNGKFENIINNASLAVNVADSNSVVMDTHALRHLTMLIKAVPAGGLDTSSVVRLIFQVRTHLNGLPDSNSVFAHYPYGSTSAGIAAGASPDSFTTGHLIKGGGVPMNNLGAVAWSGEFVVQIMGARKAHGNAVTVLGHQYPAPNGIALSLDSMFGREFWSPYTSIRVRNGSNQTCAVTVHLVGSPL